MERVKTILAATDLSSFSAKGVRYAANLAKALGAELIVVNVVETGEFLSDARSHVFDVIRVEKENFLNGLLERHKQLLDRFTAEHLSEFGAEVKIERVVKMGEPHSALVECAKSSGVDLIVMSTHGRSGLPRVLIGSVTEKVLRSSPCPVLAIPSHDE